MKTDQSEFTTIEKRGLSTWPLPNRVGHGSNHKDVKDRDGQRLGYCPGSTTHADTLWAWSLFVVVCGPCWPDWVRWLQASRSRRSTFVADAQCARRSCSAQTLRRPTRKIQAMHHDVYKPLASRPPLPYNKAVNSGTNEPCETEKNPV